MMAVHCFEKKDSSLSLVEAFVVDGGYRHSFYLIVQMLMIDAEI